jgi:valyl-tRNA synthetase
MPTDATSAPRVPDKPSLEGIEATWAGVWEDERLYRFNPEATREQVFSIDTPPPTVSGSLHMGSVFGYVQTDALARYRRMSGWELFYPMGGTTTASPPSAGSRPTSACAAIRRSPSTPTSNRRPSRG